MQEVSEKWKDAHKKPLLNESFVEVSLNIADPIALANASSNSNGEIYISNSSQLLDGVDKNPTPYCTLEQNLWCLNGKRKAIPETDLGNNGYVSDVLSNDTCVFNPRVPVITIDFTRVFNQVIPGVTITWSNTYDEFADTFEVIAYRGDTIVTSKEITGNRSVTNMIFVDIVDYDRIEIIVKKWCLPNHRARVEELYVGLHKVYGKAELFEYSHSQSVDPISTSLPKSEISFSIDNLNGEYNPYNTSGLAKYLTERQEVKTRYGLTLDDGTVEWINGGTFYLSEWYAKQNGITADFKARDLLEFMSAEFVENHDLSERSLYELAEIVLTKASELLNNDGTIKWVIDKSLEEKYTNAPLPTDTLANCLQLIANAGECVLYQDREGVLHIEPLKFDATDYKIDSFNSYSKSEVTLAKPLKQVKVKQYTYTRGDKEIESTTTEITCDGGGVGETITIDNPLITKESMARSISEWLFTHLGHRMTLDSSWRADVRLDPLDIVTNTNDYITNQVRMTDVEFKYNGAFRGTGKGKVI